MLYNEVSDIQDKPIAYVYINGIDVHLVNTVAKSSINNKTITTDYDYDSYGNVTSTKVSSTGSTSVIKSKTSYDNYGNYISSTTTANNQTSYSHTNIATDLLEYVEDANLNRTAFIYNNRDMVSTIYQDANRNGALDTNEKRVNYTYSADRLNSIITDKTTYCLTYDAYGNTSSIGITGMSASLATYIYNNYNGKLARTTYGNGFYVENVYDELDRVVGIKYNGVVKFTFTYNVSGQLYSSTDSINNKVYNYEYDSLGRLIRATERTGSYALVLETQNQFDSLGRPSASTYVTTDRSMLYSISYYDDSSLISTYGLPSSDTISYSYDAFDRLSTKDLSDVYSVTYGYYNYTDNSGVARTSGRVTSLTLNPDGSATDIVYSYTYDDVGNIIGVYSNDKYVSYDYDDLNQLICEEHSFPNTDLIRYIYTYDDAGNILSKTTDRVTPYSPSTVNTYSYENTAWGDLLTNIKVTWNTLDVLSDTAISYDAIGNPTNWINTTNMTWQGRSLSHLWVNNTTFDYSYNSSGIRTSKDMTDYSLSRDYHVSYVLDGSKIIKETYTPYYSGSSYTNYYYYDESGVTGFSYNGTDYFYGKNLQGDITKIFTASGVEVVSYTYDAWGNPISTTGSLASTVGAANPFRYRSYYYDTETGWYYLNSRYYDPSVGRFINADGIVGANGGLQGYNMFAYCNNNPVMYKDMCGYESEPTVPTDEEWYKENNICNILPYSFTIDQKALDDLYNNSNNFIINNVVIDAKFEEGVITYRNSFKDVLEGNVQEFTGGIIKGVTKFAKGIKNGVNGLADGIKDLSNNEDVRTIYDSGLETGVGGATGGAAYGVIAAPYTAGASIPICAAVGFDIGFVSGVAVGVYKVLKKYLWE